MNLLSLLVGLLTVTAPWQDPAINEINRCPMYATFDSPQEQLSLHGEWDFRFEGGEWTKIQVPGNWELQGFADPLYLNTGYAWRGHYKNNPGIPASEHNYTGIYRRTFKIPFKWLFKDIFLTLGSVTSCVSVRINGQEVGYSEDSKLAATFDITKFVRPGGKAEIELEVHRWCDGSYMEDQDFWRLSGIARDSYIYTRPRHRIEDVQIKAGADGFYEIKASTSFEAKSIEYFIDGTKVTANGYYDKARPWSAETPNLHHLTVVAYSKFLSREADRAELDFGFRTVEIKGEQLHVNGRPVLIKGVNRHEISSTGGYVVSEEEMVRDIQIMKQLNINAVRCCHYPDDPKWLDLCDKYGLYVVDEANNESHGMGYGENTLAKNPAYALTHLQRVQRMAQRDVNHPCVIIWSTGNEAGNGPNFEACYDWLKEFDPTRPVQYERAIDKKRKDGGMMDRNTDIFCPMYATYEDCEKYCTQVNDARPLIQCEYAHAMGNSMGGFKEYWDLVRKYPKYQGGFIWDFADQALKWPSKKSSTGYIYAFGGDFNDYDPSDNSFNCNGVIAADRSLHPHAYEVRHQYQNIWTKPTGASADEVEIFNENFFTSLDNYKLLWEVTSNGKTIFSGIYDHLYAPAQQSQTADLDFSLIGVKGGELMLNLKYVLKKEEPLLEAGTEVAWSQIPLGGEWEVPAAKGSENAAAEALSDSPAGFPKVSFDIDKSTGALCSYKVDGKELIAERLMPCFGRAVTENDLGAKLEQKMRPWQYPIMKVVSVENDGTVAHVVYSLDDLCIVTMDYSLAADGKLTITEKMDNVREGAPDLFRFGIETALDGALDSISFYGAGPWESYCDRKSSAFIGLYSQAVADQYHYGYPRPQESGTHVDIRWMDIYGKDGNGIRITAGNASSDRKALFEASALPFARRDIDLTITGGGRRDRGDQRHSLELRPDGKTHLIVSAAQMGLGCINSWGRLPREEYLLQPGKRSFSLTISPIKGTDSFQPSYLLTSK